MVAIIRIENQIDTELSENENERILLSKIMGEEVFGFNGVINWIIEAYNNLRSPGILQRLSPQMFASELIKLSFNERIGFYLISPAKKRMYKLYDDVGSLANIHDEIHEYHEYLCQFEFDDEEKYDMELAVAGVGDEISKSMDEWEEVAGIALSIAYANSESDIVMNDTIPCKDCLVRPRCVQPYKNRLTATQPCERLSEYKKKEINTLRERLPEWSLPLVFR